MTAFELIPKITALLTKLIERVKDGKTAALVQQIQQYQLLSLQDLIEKDAKIKAQEARIAELEAENKKLRRRDSIGAMVG